MIGVSSLGDIVLNTLIGLMVISLLCTICLLVYGAIQAGFVKTLLALLIFIAVIVVAALIGTAINMFLDMYWW